MEKETALLSQEDIFNEAYRQDKNRRISFKELISFAVLKNYIKSEEAEFVTNSYYQAIEEFILSNYEYSEDDDVSQIITDETVNIMFAIDDYLSSLKNPIKGLQQIFSSNPKDLVSYSYKVYDEKQTINTGKLKQLKEMSEDIMKLRLEYKNFIVFLSQRIKSPLASPLWYTLINGKEMGRIDNMDELSKVIDDAITEIKILRHFPQNEIVKLIGSHGDGEEYKNIIETALFNYTFNVLYKGVKSICFTETMKQIIEREIKTKMLTESDAIEVFTAEDTPFEAEELDYILTYFVRRFTSEVIKYNHLDTFKVTDKVKKRDRR